MADIVLALKPKWLELILSGKKTAEIRRVLPKNLNAGDKVYLYCKGNIHGHAYAQNVEHVVGFYQKRAVAIECSHAACLSRVDIWAYWYLASRPGVIWLKDVTRYDDPHPWRGSIPQNFVYYRKDQE